MSSRFVLVAVILSVTVACGGERAVDVAPNLLDDYPAFNADGTINVVIETPAGATGLWQVDPDGVVRRRMVDGHPRDIDYLALPANYGIIPRTLEPSESGGEGEQLDIHVLGDALDRGTVVRAHLIGALALLDKGAQDDKLIAVVDGPGLGSVRDISELDERYPGISSILETWWLNFKGQNVIESFGYVGAAAAKRHVTASTASYEQAREAVPE
jgi:inorganic pyrophosphatase